MLVGSFTTIDTVKDRDSLAKVGTLMRDGSFVSFGTLLVFEFTPDTWYFTIVWFTPGHCYYL